MRNANPQQRLILGAIIIIIGALALVDNLRLFDTRDILQFWPTVFIAVGLLKLSQANSRSGYLIGGGLVTAGTIITLNRLGIINFHMRDWWPLLLIGAGLLVIFKDKSSKLLDLVKPSTTPITSDSQVDIVAIMSGNQGNVASNDFRGGSITAIMGGVELDLRNATIQTEAVLNVTAFWGGIALKIPSDWTVVNNGMAFLGGIEDSSVPSMTAGKRLVITGMAVMGGVEIKN
ncbi:LiaI-LiaF-like domain-containing protein [Undibacterium sp. Di24W]|uniref:LiaI-LiaF-like domain-containing protein n=1 Tax=Undibacterium sp. Di24W TaxID=3413033 RepID=UPI003BEF5C19